MRGEEVDPTTVAECETACKKIATVFQENCEVGVWSIFRPTSAEFTARSLTENMDLTPLPWTLQFACHRLRGVLIFQIGGTSCVLQGHRGLSVPPTAETAKWTTANCNSGRSIRNPNSAIRNFSYSNTDFSVSLSSRHRRSTSCLSPYSNAFTSSSWPLK
jgi:hypothetical protein